MELQALEKLHRGSLKILLYSASERLWQIASGFSHWNKDTQKTIALQGRGNFLAIKQRKPIKYLRPEGRLL